MTDYVKKSLRCLLRDIRKSLPAETQQRASDAVYQHIKQMDLYRQAKRIALYHPMGGEIDLRAIWQSAPLQGKFCYFPAVTPEKTLKFLPATPKTPFQANQYGILEPAVDIQQALALSALDIIFLPLLAFDKLGTRVGMGQGYYDRTLEKLEPGAAPHLMGVAYDFQEQAYLIREPWDICLQAIVTPSIIHWSKAL